jgi:hypothetical protein
MELPKPIFVSYSISNIEKKSAYAREMVCSRIIEKIERQLAVTISSDCVAERVNDFTTDYEFRGYVVTSEQLEKLVNDMIVCRELKIPTVTFYGD